MRLALPVEVGLALALVCGCARQKEAPAPKARATLPAARGASPSAKATSVKPVKSTHKTEPGAASQPMNETPPPSGRVAAALGDEPVKILGAPDHAWAASLGLIGAAAAEKHATLKEDRRIVGYPIRGSLRALDKTISAEVGALLVDERNYLFGLVRRCKNRSWIGMRFERAGVRVELVLGKPCDQLIIAFPRDAAVRTWGAVMRSDVAKKLRRLASNSKPR